ncbi:hypothetical protein DMJ13_11095 [halophilic archaeon]|nr:hypothetical protein DMJ13_11095 [halophilic archaeon]
MTNQTQAFYAVSCPECDVQMETDTPNEIVEMYRRHSSVTGHDVEIAQAETSFADDIDGDEIEPVIRQLQEQYRNGVPIGVVAAVMSDRGLSLAATLDEIHERRMDGGLYEPQDDHLGVV